MKNAKKGAPKKKDESNNSGSSGGQPSQANDGAKMGGGPRGQGGLGFHGHIDGGGGENDEDERFHQQQMEQQHMREPHPYPPQQNRGRYTSVSRSSRFTDS